MHGGERIARVLEAQGVPCLFTLCGGHVSPILTAARARGIRIVDVRDEATAVFAADAWARLSGRPGVAVVTAGPGVTNTMTAVKNAQLAQSPVVVLGGAAPTLLKGRGALQDIDQRALLRPHVKGFFRVRRVRELIGSVQQALRLSMDGVPGPVFVECPIDVLYGEDLIREWYAAAGGGKSLQARLLGWYLRRHVARLFGGAGDGAVTPEPWPAPLAAPGRKLARIEAALRKAQRPLLVIGSQALAGPGEAARLAAAVDRLGFPVYLSGMARGLLGPRHRLHFRHQRRAALKEADVVLLAGVPCDFRLDYGRHVRRSATLISLNLSRRDLRMNRRPDIGMLADAGRALCDLAEGLDPPPDRGAWHETLARRDRERERQIEALASRDTDGVNPLALLRSIDAALPEDSIVVADGGDFVGTASYTVRPRGPLSWLDPGVFGTLGVGAGFALGAGLARPGSEIWALFGDGAFGFSLIEFDTLARHRVPVIAVVGNDGGWAQIAREQVKILGDDVGTVLARTDYHRAAEGLGAAGFLVERMEDFPGVLERARERAAGGQPVLINARIGVTDFREGSISM